MLRTILIGTLFSVFLAGCGGTGELGEGCDTPGVTTDECVEGTVCSNQSDGEAVCRKLCTEQAQCGEGENCNGISGSSLKSCQPG